MYHLPGMSQLGQTLFGGGRLMRVILTVAVLLFAVVMPLLIDGWTVKRGLLMGALEVVCMTMLGGFWLPPPWNYRASRVLTALVFLAYAAYVIDELFFSPRLFHFWGHHRGATPFQALMGFICIGLPCFWYTLFGRFTLHEPPPPAEDEGDDWDEEEAEEAEENKVNDTKPKFP